MGKGVGMELPRHLRDPKLEAALAAARTQGMRDDAAPIEIRLKNVEIQLIKELDPVSNRWFVSLMMTRGDTRWVLQLDSFNAERVGNALLAAAKLDADEAIAQQNGGPDEHS